MPDLDLAAIRARRAEFVERRRNPKGDVVQRHLDRVTLADELADDVPALLAEVDRLTAELTRLRVIVAACDGGPEARPRVNSYRVEHRASAEDGWDFSPYTFDNVMDADEAMTRLRRFNFPEGELRVVRVTRSHTVVAVDINPEATGKAAVRPPDGSDPASGIDALGP